MGSNPSYFKNCDDCPVENVSWNDIQEFLRKLNSQTGRKYRLPTEAEWEYAARGGNKSKGYEYSGSDDIYEVAWYKNNSEGKTHPVGQKKPNELGIYDMSGNVWEWCSDWYDRYDVNFYKNNRAENPVGPSSGTKRVVRGGSSLFTKNPLDIEHFPVSSTRRVSAEPTKSAPDLGFRVAQDK